MLSPLGGENILKFNLKEKINIPRMSNETAYIKLLVYLPIGNVAE